LFSSEAWEYFVSTGKVDVSARYGVPGRPERRYGWRRA
jgi:response regulator of citrate/malate metabolism